MQLEIRVIYLKLQLSLRAAHLSNYKCDNELGTSEHNTNKYLNVGKLAEVRNKNGPFPFPESPISVKETSNIKK